MLDIKRKQKTMNDEKPLLLLKLNHSHLITGLNRL